MILTFALKPFRKPPRNRSNVLKHFLLDAAEVRVSLTFSDSTKLSLTPVRKNANGEFLVDINSVVVPSVPASTKKKAITKVTAELVVDLAHDGKTFRLLYAQQVFAAVATAANSDANIDYQVRPSAWIASTGGTLRTSNGLVHPLFDTSAMASNRVEMNTLIVDLTELWDHLHKDNIAHRVYRDLSDATKVTFKVFGHLGGNSFIWFAVVPAYASKSTTLSPHVFMQPSDLGNFQFKEDEKAYLLNSPAEFADQDWIKTILLTYLLPPVEDARIATLKAKALTASDFSTLGVSDLPDLAKRRFRNVVGFTKWTATRLAPLHWNIGAGFERAFYGLGGAKPQQILMIPQPFGSEKDKRAENTPALKAITDTIIDVISTNTALFALPADKLMAKDKMILSAYSESGIDLWISSEANLPNLKAIIGIEPNNVNPQARKDKKAKKEAEGEDKDKKAKKAAAGPNGTATIPKLLKKKVMVFLIGNTFTGWYRPPISAAELRQIKFLPEDPKMLKYAPVPGSNPFVKYRVGRIEDPTKDPLLLPEEQAIVDDYKSRTPPIAGDKFFARVFRDEYNSYDWNRNWPTFYNHHFALTGGRIMVLGDQTDFYRKPPTSYLTFFQEAVEEIK